MFIPYKFSVSQEKRIKNNRQNLKRDFPEEYLRSQAERVEKFVDTAQSLIRKSCLTIGCVGGVCRVSMKVPFDNETCQILGYIVEDEIVLDCNMIYKRLIRMNPEFAFVPRKLYFKELFDAGVLTRCRHIRQFVRCRTISEWAIKQIPGYKPKFYTVSNRALQISGTQSFAEVRAWFDVTGPYSRLA